MATFILSSTNIMIENFITIPVVLDIKRDHSTFQPRYDITKKEIPSNWKSIESPIDISGYDNYAILCGKVSGITVIDIAPDIKIPIENSSYVVCTPSGGRHFYFQYENKLKSIYDLPNGISILNNDRLVFAGEHYRLYNTIDYNQPAYIPKMPNVLLNALIEQQEARTNAIDQKHFDLLSLLPDHWFEDEALYRKLVNVLRNAMHETKAIDTMREVLVNKFDYRHPRFAKAFESRMSWKDERYKTITLIREAGDRISPSDLLEWKSKYSPKAERNVYEKKKRLVYKEGSMTKLKDIQKHFDLTAKQLQQKDNRWTPKNIKLCVHCNSKHIKGCCAEYNSIDRSTYVFISNVCIV